MEQILTNDDIENVTNIDELTDLMATHGYKAINHGQLGASPATKRAIFSKNGMDFTFLLEDGRVTEGSLRDDDAIEHRLFVRGGLFGHECT